MKAYDVILWDADNTLFDYEAAERATLRNTFDIYGLPFDPDADIPRYQAINDALWRRFELGEIGQPELRIDRFARLLEAYPSPPDTQAFSDTYLHALGECRMMIPGALETVKFFKDRGAAMCVVTNGIVEVQRNRFGGSPLGELLPRLIISQEAGCQKPDPRMIHLALAALNHDRLDTVLMVGDSIQTDILCGIRAGVDTCWFNPQGKTAPPDITPTYTIANLMELLEQ